jgi:AcrR family transcriptional regulator
MTRARESKDGYHHGDLRNALLKAGRELLTEEGPEQLSLREVARRAGVSHAAPYRHFESREALVAAIAEEGFAALTRSMLEAAQGAKTTRERLLRLGQGYVRFALDHPAEVKNMFAGGGFDAAPAGLVAEAKGAFEVLVEAVRAAQAEGALAGKDPLPVATTCWALVHGLALLMLQNALVPAGFTAGSADALTRRTLLHLLEGLGR